MPSVVPIVELCCSISGKFVAVASLFLRFTELGWVVVSATWSIIVVSFISVGLVVSFSLFMDSVVIIVGSSVWVVISTVVEGILSIGEFVYDCVVD